MDNKSYIEDDKGSSITTSLETPQNVADVFKKNIEDDSEQNFSSLLRQVIFFLNELKHQLERNYFE